MKFKCMNCGKEVELHELKHDSLNLEGFYANCDECGGSNDIDSSILNGVFLMDVAKMADFKVLSKERFLESYSYLTEEEYDATKLYFDWLMSVDDTKEKRTPVYQFKWCYENINSQETFEKIVTDIKNTKEAFNTYEPLAKLTYIDEEGCAVIVEYQIPIDENRNLGCKVASHPWFDVFMAEHLYDDCYDYKHDSEGKRYVIKTTEGEEEQDVSYDNVEQIMIKVAQKSWDENFKILRRN